MSELLPFVGLALLAVGCFHGLRPPEPAPKSAPAPDFSAERAMEQLEQITMKAHPTGSPENARVRAAIVNRLAELDLDPHVQTASAANSALKWGPPYPAATVHNVVARLKGAANTKAVMLSAHYDSVGSGPGAGDDGSGCVTLLETARALKSSEPLRNDVLFLFTDGEELGLLGAKAFADEHPWLHDVGLEMNFDSRGSCGPALMFETSPQNSWLLREFAQAAPRPVTSSLFYEGFKYLPNDTDMTIFKRAGLAGLNFGYVGCWPRYHSARDDVLDIDKASIQHLGSYALGLTRGFGDLDLTLGNGSEDIYFNIFRWTIHYPRSWAAPLMMVVGALFVLVAIRGSRRGRLSWGGVAVGFAAWLAGTGAAVAFGQLGWGALKGLKLASLLPYGPAYNGDTYAASFILFAIAIIAGFYTILVARRRVADLTLGSLLWWLLAAGFSSFCAKGGSYLFVWPLLLALVAFDLGSRDHTGAADSLELIAWMAAAGVGIVLAVPVISILVSLLSTSGLALILIVVAMLVGLHTPFMARAMPGGRGWLLAPLFSVALVLLFFGMVRSGYSAANPRAEHLFYVLDADEAKGYWVSGEEHPTPWTSEYLGPAPIRSNLRHLGLLDMPDWEGSAPALNLAPPSAMAIDDVSIGDERNLRLRVASSRQARVLWFIVRKAQIRSASINGKWVATASHGGDWSFVYTGASGQDLAVQIALNDSERPEIVIADQSDGLPEIPGTVFGPRPPDTMPWPGSRWDSSTVVKRTFTHFDMHH